MYPVFVLIMYSKTTNMETIIRKGEAYTHRFLETGGRTCHAGPHGEAPGSDRMQKKSGESMAQSLFGGRNG